MKQIDVTDILADILHRNDIRIDEDKVEGSFNKELIHIINEKQDLL